MSASTSPCAAKSPCRASRASLKACAENVRVGRPSTQRVKVKDLDIGELTVTLSPSAEFDKVTHSGLFLAIDTHFAKLFRPFERSEPLDLESGGPPSFEP